MTSALEILGIEIILLVPSLIISLIMERENKKYVIATWLISIIISAPLIYLLGYIFCPTISFKSGVTWIMSIILLFIPYLVINIVTAFFDGYGLAPLPVSTISTIGILALVSIIITISGSKLFNATAYSRLIKVEKGQTTDIPTAESTKAIALMDTVSASKLGNRKIGSLTDVVSQYEINADDYEQINYKGKPAKVAPLSYAGFFKWNGNKDKGVPGYIIVDPTSMNAKFVRLDKYMKYVPSAHFKQNLTRHIKSKYPRALIMNTHFEIDENGQPYYITSVYTHPIRTFGGIKITGIYVTDPVTGKITHYNVGNVPEWIDEVYPAEVICDNYNNYAQLSKGFWNSIIGQKGCKKITEMRSDDNNDDSDDNSDNDNADTETDYGYIAKNDDIYIFTGITSVRNDSSNLGFLLANERTGKTEYIRCNDGTVDEATAEAAAEGSVQQTKYTASFPSLILIDGQPTYIMALRDKSLITKGYACVGAEDYSKIVVKTTQGECIRAYKELLSENGGDTDIDLNSSNSTDKKNASGDAEKVSYVKTTVTADKVLTLDKNGNTYLYIRGRDGKWYNAKFVDVLGLAGIKAGDTIDIMTDNKGNFKISTDNGAKPLAKK